MKNELHSKTSLLFLYRGYNCIDDNHTSKFKNLIEMNVMCSSQPVSIKFQLHFVLIQNNTPHLIIQFGEWKGTNMKLTENGSNDKTAAHFL